MVKLKFNINKNEFVGDNDLIIDKREFISNKLKENSGDFIKYETEILDTSTGDEIYQDGNSSSLNNFDQFLTHVRTNNGLTPYKDIDIIVKENEIIVEYESGTKSIVSFITIK